MSSRMRVTETRSISNANGTTTLYEIGYDGIAPDDHVARMVAAGAAIELPRKPLGRDKGPTDGA